MVDKEKQSVIAIAALMHDVGKFKQRAYGGDEAFICPEALAMQGQLLPHSQDGRYTHRHALWTYDFFLQDFKNMINDSDNQFLWNIEWEKIARLAASHHNPSTEEERIVTKADCSSAGLDRDSLLSYENGMYVTNPLRSLIAKIGQDQNGERSTYSYHLSKLTSEEYTMPENGVHLSVKEYRTLYDGFKLELENSLSNISGYEQLIRKLKDLLLEYTWCIPSATNDYLSDVSLYDHSITTMSIALALLCSEENGTQLRICAFGISGIQSFIFQHKFASFKNAAKIFRGRSFIVSVFSTAFEKYLCSKLDLIPFLDVMDAGGNITLLLPDTEEIVNELEKCQKEIELFLLEKYHATLSIVMDYSIVSNISDFGMGKYKKLRKEIGKSLNLRKSQKFRFAIGEKGYVLDSIPGSRVCEACGKHGTGDDNTELCILCQKQKKLGQDIPVKNLMMLSFKEGDYEILPSLYLSFVDYLDYVNAGNSIWAMNSTYESYPAWRINNYTSGEDFEDLAANSVNKNGKGKPFLAYVKIDVDSLGQIINDGMNESEYSVSRFATLSRTLHHFFNMYVHSLLEKDYPHSYTVLSGGDDLFLIMPWNTALLFVQHLKQDFKMFCSNNPTLHFSAGIVIAKAKEPFAFVNDKVNFALDEKAKKFKGKNAISFMGVSFSLNDLDEFIDEYNTFRSFVQSEERPNAPLSTGFVYRLYQYILDMLSEKNDEISLTRKYGTCSRLHYDIARNINPRNEKEEECQNAIKYVIDKLINYSNIKELEKFKLILIQTLYDEMRTTSMEER